MKILLISEPYIERMLFDYFAQIPFHQFILLKENHPKISKCEINNIILYDIDDALLRCDFIYILSSEQIPYKMIDKCHDFATKTGKKIYIDSYDNSIDSIDAVNSYTSHVLSLVPNNKPCILVLQVGKYAQIERIELSVCLSLTENSVKYSLHSNSLINKILYMSKLLDITVPMVNNDKESQITIITIKTGVENLLNNDVDTIFFDYFMRKLRPDYIIMACENGYDLNERLNEVFKIKFSRSIDIFVPSEYATLKFNNKDTVSLFIEGKTKMDFFDDIKKKLTFPSGIRELKIINV